MDRDTTEALSALLASEPLPEPAERLAVESLCPWHSAELRRRQRFVLALESPCPACHTPARAYCRSHSGAPLSAKVHHERAQLAERTHCTCGL